MYSLALIIFVVSEKKAFLYKVSVFYADRKSKMAATAGHRLTLGPMGKYWHKKHKMCRGPSNDHSWAVWFQLSMWFQRRSVLKHFPRKFIGWSSTNLTFFVPI
jgi:hypothetical protein